MKKHMSPPEPIAAPRVPTICDMVITPISERKGKIIKIEEKPYVPNGSVGYWEGQPKSFKEYTIELKLPCRFKEEFRTVMMILHDYDLELI